MPTLPHTLIHCCLVMSYGVMHQVIIGSLGNGLVLDRRQRVILFKPQSVNTLRPGQNGRHFPDNIFKCIFSNENAWISITFSFKFVPNVRIPAIGSDIWFDADQAASHYLNQWWLVYWRIYVSLGLNELRPRDSIWRQRSWSPLVQAITCCPTAPRHYLNQCSLIINGILCHLQEMLKISLIWVWKWLI